MTSAAVRLFAAPTPEELIARAKAMIPEIRELAEETERNRTISPKIIGMIRDAELLRTCRPKEFGGFEYDAAVALEIALGVGGLRFDRLGSQRRPIQRHLVRSFPDRSAAGIVGWRGRPVQLRLLCPDRHRGADR